MSAIGSSKHHSLAHSQFVQYSLDSNSAHKYLQSILVDFWDSSSSHQAVSWMYPFADLSVPKLKCIDYYLNELLQWISPFVTFKHGFLRGPTHKMQLSTVQPREHVRLPNAFVGIAFGSLLNSISANL